MGAKEIKRYRAVKPDADKLLETAINKLSLSAEPTAGNITRTYDALDRLTSEQTPQGTVGYTYDAASRRATMSVPNQALITYTYDNADRLTQITQGSATVSYTYDAAGRRTSLTLPNNVLVEYGYDNASRLTSITYKQNGTTVLGNLTYAYDKNGNRLTTGGSFARTGIPEAVGSTAYNTANRQTTFADKTLTYDNNGNLQTITDSNGTTTYTWNPRNQLVGISGPGVNATFVYDGLGRREKKTVNGNLTEFLYDRLNPVQETSSATILANILPGFALDEFLTRTDVIAGVTSNFLTDALGSPVAVTDNAGIVQTEYTYEPFGKTTFGGSSNSNSCQYTGRESDGTALYYYRARYYDPILQRFISEDSLNIAHVQVNASDETRSFIAHTFLANIADPNGSYVYVTNNPTNLADPSGLIGLRGSAGLGAGLGATGAIGTRKTLLAAAVGAALGLAQSPAITAVPAGPIAAVAGFVGGAGTGLAAAAVRSPNETGAALTAGVFGGIGGALGGGWGATFGTAIGVGLGQMWGDIFPFP